MPSAFRGLRGIVILILILTLAIYPVFAFSQSDFHVAIVSKVYGHSEYIPRWSNVFKPGETLKLYLSASNVNLGRAAAVDFVVIIKDPKGYVVYGKVINERTLSYKNDIYTTVNIDISNDWINGRYTIDAYAFDVLNATKTELSYTNLYYEILYSGNKSPSVYTISRKSAPNVKKTLYFYIKNKVPQKFCIFGEELAAKTLPLNVPNKLKVFILNPMDVKGTTTVRAIVNGKTVNSKTVEIGARQIKEVALTIPPLKPGEYIIKVRADNAEYLKALPIVVSPLIYNKPVYAGDVLNGTLIYSPNNYVLGSVNLTPVNHLSMNTILLNLNKSSLNKYDAEKMITNMLAYIYSQEHHHGIMKVALLDVSNNTAKKVLPVLLDEIKIETRAPIEYVGVRSVWNLNDVDVAFYVGSNPSVLHLYGMKYFFNKGGALICDNPNYWTNYKDYLANVLLYMGGWKYNSGIYSSYYNLNINKGIKITISKATKLPPKFVYLSLKVRGPPLSGMPPLVNVSTPVNISLTVKNVGSAGKNKVEVIINGKTVYNKSIFLYTGQTKNITFQYIPTKPGNYKVMIPGTSYMRIFFVKSSTGQVGVTPTPSKKAPEHKTGAIFVAGSAIVLAVLVILRIFLRD